jgi:hypothetical protein
MRWAVEYELPSGSIGLCIFSAEDETAAQVYVSDMRTRFGHDHLFNLNQLANGGGIEELYRLFPRMAKGTNTGEIAKKSLSMSGNSER